MHSRLTRLYHFLSGKWRIPLEPGHYLDLLVLLVLLCLLGLLTLWQGGMSAEALPWAAKIFAIALCFHVFAITQRAREGFGLRPVVWIFIPWLVWVLCDWLFFSPKPWLAEIELITSVMVFGVFGIGLYHLRHEWLRWITWGLLAAFVSVAASLALGDQQHMMRVLWDKEIAPVYDGMFSGTLGHPAVMGALLLMAFFPALSVLLSRRWGAWQRILAAYFTVILAIGIFFTHHLGVWLGFVVGIVIIGNLLIKKIFGRVLLVLLTLFALYWGVTVLHTDVGCLRQCEEAVTRDAGDKFPLVEAAWDAFKQAPIQGVGQGGFANFFEKNRPAHWESTPVTAGSLPLTVLAENGLVGFLLLLGPACWIWFHGLAVCLRMPFFEKTEKAEMLILSVRKKGRKHVTSFLKKGSLIYEPRIFLAGLLSGTAAAAVLLMLDYPASAPVVGCFFALSAAAILKLTGARIAVFHAKKLSTRIALGAAVVLKPAVWLLWVLAPLTAASLVEISSQHLRPFLPSLKNSNQWYASAPDRKTLQLAGEAACAAVKANPYNGDAWYWLSLASLRLYTVNPDDAAALGNTAVHAARRAVELAPGDADFLAARGATLLMAGERDEALDALRAAAKKAPNNLAVLLVIADILGQRGETRQEALDILNRAQELHPGHPYIQQRRSFLQLGSDNSQPDKK